MGHRTLVAYRLTDGTFALHYAHWGRGLAADLGPTTPFGGSPETTDRTDPDAAFGPGPDDCRPPRTTRVDPRPLGTRLDADAVLATVDAAVESLVVVSPLFETATHLVCSLDPLAGSVSGAPPPVEDSDDDTAFVRPDGDPERLRAWFVEEKSAVSAAVAGGTLSPAAGRRRLRDGLASRGTLFPPDDAWFLRDD